MRPKVVIAILVLGGLLVAGTLWLRPAASEAPPSAPQNTPRQIAEGKPPPAPANTTESQALPGPQSTTPEAAAQSTPARQEAYVEKRIAELEDLAADDAPASLETIVSELTNRDPRIRKAAREAAIQFGSRDAIPRLLEAAAQTDDPQEKLELQEAADFLKLPTPAELAASRASQSPAPPPAGSKPPVGAK